MELRVTVFVPERWRPTSNTGLDRSEIFQVAWKCTLTHFCIFYPEFMNGAYLVQLSVVAFEVLDGSQSYLILPRCLFFWKQGMRCFVQLPARHDFQSTEALTGHCCCRYYAGSAQMHHCFSFFLLSSEDPSWLGHESSRTVWCNANSKILRQMPVDESRQAESHHLADVFAV